MRNLMTEDKPQYDSKEILNFSIFESCDSYKDNFYEKIVYIENLTPPHTFLNDFSNICQTEI